MKTLQYIDMTYEELESLDRNSTVVFSSISPIETHGPHLPLGTDIFIAESLRDRIIEKFGEKHPDFTALILPTIPFGADAIPVAGSLAVGHQAVYRGVLDIGKALADLGFRYWLLTDNHGGPTHEIGIEVAARKLRIPWRHRPPALRDQKPGIHQSLRDTGHQEIAGRRHQAARGCLQYGIVRCPGRSRRTDASITSDRGRRTGRHGCSSCPARRVAPRAGDRSDSSPGGLSQSDHVAGCEGDCS